MRSLVVGVLSKERAPFMDGETIRTTLRLSLAALVLTLRQRRR
jgi:hypothetical protein